MEFLTLTIAGFPGRNSTRRMLLAGCLTVCASIAITVTGCAASAQAADSTPLYRTAASIHELSAEQSNRHAPVHLRGVVIRTTEWGIVVADRTGGVWVYYGHPYREFSAGDAVEVIGVAGPGLYSPDVNATSVRKLGRAPLPHPKQVDFKELSTGNYDAQYVTFAGIVRSAGIRPAAAPSQNFWMRVEMNDGTIDVALPGDCAEAAGKLIDALVQFKGAGSSAKNQSRQITAPTLMMSGMEGITVLRPPPQNLFSVPLTPLGRLMQYRSGTDYYHRVRVAGTVTYFKPGESLIIEDRGSALFAETPQLDSIKVGDRVEVLGFPAASRTGPILRDAIIRDINPGQQLQPASVKPADLSTGKFNYNFVSTQGRLLRKVREPSRDVLLLQIEASLLLAELAKSDKSNELERVREGSIVRISGISILDITGDWNAGGADASSINYRLLLRSPDDIQIVQLPSWWTRTHIIYIAGVLASLALIFFAMVVYGRREGWRLQAILGERERLAHEMHDTLAQSFAGIGFQLQAIRKAIPVEQKELREQVDLARALVRHSHKEARRSIDPMSTETLDEIDLLSSLETSARKMVEGGSVQVISKVTGVPRSLPRKTSVFLSRIGQEAIANSVRHADPAIWRFPSRMKRNL